MAIHTTNYTERRRFSAVTVSLKSRFLRLKHLNNLKFERLLSEHNRPEQLTLPSGAVIKSETLVEHNWHAELGQRFLLTSIIT